jgi:hypothetical protein
MKEFWCQHFNVPFLRPFLPPAKMTGCCEKHQTCPMCGFGWSEAPHRCEKEETPLNLIEK